MKKNRGWIFIPHVGGHRYFNVAQSYARANAPTYNIKNPYTECLNPADTYLHSRLESFRRNFFSDTPNPSWIERLCFERYIYCATFCQIHDIEGSFMMDSDFLLLSDPARLEAKIIASQFDFVASSFEDAKQFPKISSSYSPHLSWWKTQSLLDFVDYFISFYELNYEVIKHSAENICDMTLLGSFVEAHQPRAACWSQVCDITTGFIDHNINSPMLVRGEVNVMRWGFKRLRQEEGLFYTTSNDNRVFPVLGLHFQGAAKVVLRLIEYVGFGLYSLALGRIVISIKAWIKKVCSL